MKKYSKTVVLMILFVSTMASIAFSSEFVVSGRICNELGIPIDSAEIIYTDLDGNDYSTSADSVGYYEITLPVKTAAVESDIPQVFTLYPNYPNPFNPSTTISFQLPERCTVSLNIYNALGQHVITLADGEYTAGYHSLTWNGCNADGLQVAAGIYMYALKTPYGLQKGKMTLLDGGGKNGSSGSVSGVSKIVSEQTIQESSAVFNLRVMADGYYEYVETGVAFDPSSEEAIKDAILEITEPRLFCEPEWLKSHMGGGGIVFVELAAPADFEDSVEIEAYGYTGLHIMLDRTFLSRSHPLAELTIRPDSTLNYNLADYDNYVFEHRILIRAEDPPFIEDIYVQLKIIKELSFEIDSNAPPPDSVLIAFNDIPDIEFDIEQDWFKYVANQNGFYFDYMYPHEGESTTYFESPEWHIVKIFYGYPPIPTWYLLRKRGDKSPVAVVETDIISKSAKVVEVNEFPFDFAFWWYYSWRK